MRRLIILLFFLVVSVWAGVEIMRHPGYLLVVFHPWIVQMPLWFALLAALFFLLLFYVVINSFDRLGFLWFQLKNGFRRRREQKSYSNMQLGLTALIEGRWKKAEKYLLAGVNQSVEPLINYLFAARAAHELGASDRRDRYIRMAYQMAPHAKLAIGLTQAELEMGQGQREQARATLNHLRETSPYHPKILSLLEKLHVQAADWEQLRLLLPAIRKAKLLTGENHALFEKNIYCEILCTSSGRSLGDLHRFWEQVPRHIRKNPDVVCAYVMQLRRYLPSTMAETTREMEALISQTLKYHWQPQLARIYGTLTFTSPDRQLAIVGTWLNKYGQRPALLLTLGRLCVKVQLWGKARDYFEKCLAQGPDPETSLEYGKLLEQLGETDLALKQYREGLMKIPPDGL